MRLPFAVFPAASLVAALALSGCNSAPAAVNVDAKTITLADALGQIRDALEQSHLAATASGQYLGLDPCTVTVAFTVTLTVTADNKLGVTLAAAPP